MKLQRSVVVGTVLSLSLFIGIPFARAASSISFNFKTNSVTVNHSQYRGTDTDQTTMVKSGSITASAKMVTFRIRRPAANQDHTILVRQATAPQTYEIFKTLAADPSQIASMFVQCAENTLPTQGASSFNYEIAGDAPQYSDRPGVIDCSIGVIDFMPDPFN